MKSNKSSKKTKYTGEKLLKELWATEDVYGLCKIYFRVTLTPLQERIVSCVAFDHHPRTVISCMTRYGKSYSVALGILLWIISNLNKRIVIIAPTNEKTSIIRNYLSHFVTQSTFFMQQLDLDKTGAERIKKEVSRRRMTWKNGVEMRTLSAEGKGEALMGFGADKVICFPKNTLIKTKKGLKRIQDIKQNDSVLSFNNGFQYKKVKRIFKNKSPKKLIKIITSEGNIICTENHPFYTNNGIKSASTLCVLDKIYKYINTFQNKPQQGVLAEVTITGIKRISTKEEIVYNLEVEHNHNYFANEFLVHNCDEECDIDYETYRSKITRMLGDHPEDSTYIGIGNPWKRTNQMYQHWIDPNWYKIHIGWKDALQEGRITQAFVDEQRSILTDYEFKVLYDAEFPDEDIDSLIKWEWIVKAQREIPDNLPKSL